MRCGVKSLHYPTLCAPAKRAKESRSLIPHSPNPPTSHPILHDNWEISILLHILEQIPSLITDAFQSRHHYIFRPLSFKMYWKTFMPVPRGSLLLLCYALISLFSPTACWRIHLLFIFCLYDLCVDGIHLAYPLFFTLLWRQAATVCCSY